MMRLTLIFSLGNQVNNYTVIGGQVLKVNNVLGEQVDIINSVCGGGQALKINNVLRGRVM